MGILATGARYLMLGWGMLVAIAICACASLFAQDVSAPEVVEIYWLASRTISVPGVSQIVVVDDSICRAEVSGDHVRLFGLARGETAALAWVGAHRIAFRINVLQPPAILPPPQLSQLALRHAGYGSVGSSTQYFNDSSGASRIFLQHQFSWDQNTGDGHLSIRTQANDSMGGSPAPGFNLTAGSVQYREPRFAVSLFDFALHVNGAGHDIAPLPNSNTVVLRGADLLLQSGANSYEFFAGATPSYYYLTLTGTKDVAGFTFSRKQSQNLELFSTAGIVKAPSVWQSTGPREVSAFDTTGFLFHPTRNLLLQASAGASTEGGIAQGAATYTSGDLSAFLAAARIASDFPLNRLQMFTATKASIISGIRYRFTPRVYGNFDYRHTSGTTLLLQSATATSDLLNPNVTFFLSPSQALGLNYTYSLARGNALTSQHGNRVDVALNSQLSGHLSNTAQVDVGQLRDPLQLRTASDLSLRDTVSVPIKGQSLWFSFQHQRTSKPLVSLLNDELSLLSPALQQQFLQDPLAFVNSPNMPPDVLAILRGLQPTDTEASVFLQLHLFGKLQLRPNFAYQRNTLSPQQQSSNKNFGYALLYQASPSLEFQSSLSNVFLYNSIQNQFQRSTVFSVGALKTFRASPVTMVLPHRQHSIRGRVFRDVDGNGAFNEGEPGIAGMRVELDNSRIAMTDAQGRYEFQHVTPGRHTVVLPLAQFNHNVRVTTLPIADVELVDQKSVTVDFGIVDFARLMGTVYNDYAMGGLRRTDAPGLRSVQIVIDGANLHRIVTADSAGEFEFDYLPAGDYSVTVDPATVPSNFVAAENPLKVQLGPTSTLVQDIPLRALRSISGHVYLKSSAPAPPPDPTDPRRKRAQLRAATRPAKPVSGDDANSEFTPLAGVRIAAGESITATDADGSFTLRELPAGDLEIRLLPVSDLPPGINTPTGHVQLPREPISVTDATIVISNPKLLKHLVDTSRPATALP